MTQEEEDAKVGRVLRESREAENDLVSALKELDSFTGQLAALVEALKARSSAAHMAGSLVEQYRERDIVTTRKSDAPLDLGRYAAVLNYDALVALQDRVTAAAARAAEKRKEARDLKV